MYRILFPSDNWPVPYTYPQASSLQRKDFHDRTRLFPHMDSEALRYQGCLLLLLPSLSPYMHRPPGGMAGGPENPGSWDNPDGNPVPTAIRSAPHLPLQKISAPAQRVQNPESFLSPDALVPHIWSCIFPALQAAVLCNTVLQSGNYLRKLHGHPSGSAFPPDPS